MTGGTNARGCDFHAIRILNGKFLRYSTLRVYRRHMAAQSVAETSQRCFARATLAAHSFGTGRAPRVAYTAPTFAGIGISIGAVLLAVESRARSPTA